MGVNAMEIRVHIQKVLIFTIKTCYRSACEHPIILGMLLFFLFLYRFLPFLFFFLVSSSPVIICTAVLLGTLLSLGNPYIPEIIDEEDKIRKTHHEISSLRSRVVGNDLVVEKDEHSFSVRTHVNRSRDVNNFVFSEKNHEDDDGSSRGSIDSVDGMVEESAKENRGEKLVIDEFEEEEKPLIEEENDVAVQYANLREKEIEGEEEEHFGIVQYSAISNEIEDNEVSSEYDSDSDRAESSSPDASLAEIIPMLDELHPLLDSEPIQPALVSVDEDVDSEESHESSDGSDEEVENTEIEEEQQEGKDGGPEAVVTWTKEDERNLMDLGNSELERNRRLESLIARRRARKSFRMMMTERNLIDLDGGDPPFKISPISTARRNPFDLHYDSNEGMDLPPIPGSAPSTFAARRNPFDIPYDPLEERPNLAGGSFVEEFMTSHEKDMHFRRYESFSVGESKQDKRPSKFRPYFVPEEMHSEGISYPTFQRQMSEISESKMSSVTETETVSSASDQENDKNISEQELSQEIHHVEPEMSQPVPHVERVVDHVSVESSFSEEVDLVELDQEHPKEADAVEENADNKESTSVEMESIVSPSPMGSNNPDIYMTPEVVEGNHTEVSSSSSSEVHDMIFHESTSEGFATPGSKRDDVVADYSTQLFVVNSNLTNRAEEIDDSHTKEPVYDIDYSPSGVEKTLSGVTIIEEALNYVDKRVLTPSSSIVSDMPAEALKVASTPVQEERIISSVNEEISQHSGSNEEKLSSGEGLRTDSSHLHTVEEDELRSREVSLTSEHDVTQTGFSADKHEDDVFSVPMGPSVTEKDNLGSSSSVTEFEDADLVSEEARHKVEKMKEITNLKANEEISRLESEEASSPVAVFDDHSEVVHGDGDNDSSNHSSLVASPALIPFENEPVTSELKFEHDQEEIQNSHHSKILEHSKFPCMASEFEVTDKELNLVQGIEEIDEGLLTELDAVGDFGVPELERSTNETDTLVVVEEEEKGLQALKADSLKDIEDDSCKTQVSVQAPTTSQGLDKRSAKEVDLITEQLSADEIKDHLEPIETEDVLGEITKVAKSAVATEDDISGIQILEDNPSQNLEESYHKPQDSMEALADWQDLEARSEEEEEDLTLTPKPTEFHIGSGTISAGILELEAIDVPDSEEFMTRKTRPSVEPSDSEVENAYEASRSSRSHDTEKETGSDAVCEYNVEELGTTQNEDFVMVPQVLEENSFRGVEYNSDTYEASSLSETHRSEKKTGPNAVVDFNVEELEITQSEDVEDNSFKDVNDDSYKPNDTVETLADSEDVEDNSSKDATDEPDKPNDTMEILADSEDVEDHSSKDVKDESHKPNNSMEIQTDSEEVKDNSSKDVKESPKPNDTMEALADSQSLGVRSEGEVPSAPKELSKEIGDTMETVADFEEVKDNSSKDVKDEFPKPNDTMEAPADSQSLGFRSEGEVPSAPKELSAEIGDTMETVPDSEEVKDNSSKDVKDESPKPNDTMEAQADSQSLGVRSGEVPSAPKELSAETGDTIETFADSGEDKDNSSIDVKDESHKPNDTMEALADSQTYVEESNLEVKEMHEASSSSITKVKKKKKGSGKSSSTSSSSSSSSSSDSD